MDSSDLRNQLDEAKDGSGADDETQKQPHDSEPDAPGGEASAEEPISKDNSDSTEEETVDEAADEDEPVGGPSFTSAESDKTTIYPHNSNSRFITVLCNAVENDLLALGHDDFEKREAHDAMVRLAYENPREVTRLILEARDLDPDAVDDLP